MTDDISLKPMVSMFGIAAMWGVLSTVLPRTLTVPDTIYEYCNTGDTSYTLANRVYRMLGQTFTPSTSHILNRIRLKCFRQGSPGDITFTIKQVASSRPTATVLSTLIHDGSNLSLDSNGQWVSFDMPGCSVYAGTMYAIAVSGNFSTGNAFGWRLRFDPIYEGGTRVSSMDYGSTWDVIPTSDHMFEEWQSAHTIIHSPLFG